MNKEQQELSEPTMETELPALDVKMYRDDGFDNIVSTKYEDTAEWIAVSDYRKLFERERELQAKIAVGDGSCDHCGAVPSIIMPTSLCDKCADGVKRAEAAESQLLAKDALIASLKESLQSTLDRESATTARYDARIEALEVEISKQNKAEDELLATGEKLAEEKA